MNGSESSAVAVSDEKRFRMRPAQEGQSRQRELQSIPAVPLVRA